MSNAPNMRNWKRHTYTVIREESFSNVRYYRGEGLIQPSSSVASIQVGTTAFEINNEIIIYTQQDFPKLDTSFISGKPEDFIGDSYSPDYIVWHGVSYYAYGLGLWSRLGKNSYRKVVCFYNSGNPELPTAREINWYEIDDFNKAVDTTEMALELKLAKIDLCSLVQ